MTNLHIILKRRDITLPTKFHLVKAMVFPVVMCECESWLTSKNLSFHKESWAPNNWCFWTVVSEKTLEYPLDCNIKPVNPKGNQPWIFIGRTDAEVEAPILWLPDAKSQLIWKDPDAGKELKAVGEENDRGRDGWMTSPTRWTFVGKVVSLFLNMLSSLDITFLLRSKRLLI